MGHLFPFFISSSEGYSIMNFVTACWKFDLAGIDTLSLSHYLLTVLCQFCSGAIIEVLKETSSLLRFHLLRVWSFSLYHRGDLGRSYFKLELSLCVYISGSLPSATYTLCINASCCVLSVHDDLSSLVTEKVCYLCRFWLLEQNHCLLDLTWMEMFFPRSSVLLNLFSRFLNIPWG